MFGVTNAQKASDTDETKDERNKVCVNERERENKARGGARKC